MKKEAALLFSVVILFMFITCCAPATISPEGNESFQTALAQTFAMTTDEKYGIPTNTRQVPLDKTYFPTNTPASTSLIPASQEAVPTPESTFFMPPTIANLPVFFMTSTHTPTPTRTAYVSRTVAPYYPVVDFIATNLSVYYCGGTQYLQVIITNDSNIPLESAKLYIQDLTQPAPLIGETHDTTPFHFTLDDCGPGIDRVKALHPYFIVALEPWRDFRSGHTYAVRVAMSISDSWDSPVGYYDLPPYYYNP